MPRLKKRADGRYQRKIATPLGPKWVYGKSMAELRANEQEFRERMRTGAPVRDATRSTGSWLTEWAVTDLRISDRAESTKLMYQGYCRTWLIPVLGSVRLDRLSPGDITRLMLAMKDAGKSDSTRRNAYTVLRKALDDAVTNGLLATNPAHRVKQPQPKRNEAGYLTTEEVRELLARAADYRYAEVLKLIVLTGLRRGEALALRWSDIDLDKAEGRVNGCLVRQKGVLVTVSPKTLGSRRTIALSERAVALMSARKKAQAAERLRAGNLWTDSGLVFTTEFGKPVEPQNLLRITRVAAEKAGLTGVKVHTLRHTYATVALMADVPLKVVSTNMGHASIQITADTYGHVTDVAARAAAEAVSGAYAF